MPHLGRLLPPVKGRREQDRLPPVWACLPSALLADLPGGGAQEDTGRGLQRGGVRTHSLEEGRRGTREKLPPTSAGRNVGPVGQEWGGGAEYGSKMPENRGKSPRYLPGHLPAPHGGELVLPRGVCRPHGLQGLQGLKGVRQLGTYWLRIPARSTALLQVLDSWPGREGGREGGSSPESGPPGPPPGLGRAGLGQCQTQSDPVPVPGPS